MALANTSINYITKTLLFTVLGMKFAFAQSKAGLATILANYDVVLAAKQELPLTTTKTTFLLGCENGIWLNFIDRKK